MRPHSRHAPRGKVTPESVVGRSARKRELALAAYRDSEQRQKALRLAETIRQTDPWGVLSCDGFVLEVWLDSRRSFYRMLAEFGELPAPKSIKVRERLPRLAGDAAERQYLRYEGTRYGLTPFIRSFSGAKKTM